MRRLLENVMLIVFLVLACGAGLAWLHSNRVGYQRSWSDSRQEVCGRLASVGGRVFWQRCNLAPFPVSEPMASWRLVMPKDFVVGTNPTGERVIITCAGIPVPFVSPQPGTIGYQDRSSISATGGTRWSASWCELVVPYWLIVILLLVGPVEVGVRRLFKVIKQSQVALKDREPRVGCVWIYEARAWQESLFPAGA